LVEPYVRLQTRTETKPILEINVGANLMFALLTTIVCELMTEGKRFKFILEHRLDKGFCPEGEHKVRPYIGFGYWLDSITTIYLKIYERLLNKH
jgi:hypothetical protein